MNATQAQNEIQRLTNKLRDAEKALAKEAAKVAARDLKLSVIEKLAVDTAGDPAELLQKIAKMFEVEQ